VTLTLLRFSVVIVMASLIPTVEGAQHSSSAGGLELLQRASQEYAKAKWYHIQMVEEESVHNNFQRSWVKTFLDAAEGSGNRFRYEGRTGWGTELRVSDGINVSTYRANDHIYTQRPLVSSSPNEPFTMGYLESQTIQRAKNLRNDLAELSGKYKSAKRLADQIIRVNGRFVSCYVVRVGLADTKRNTDDFYEETIWIEKDNYVFIQRKAQHDRVLYAGDTHSRQSMKETITYPFTTLNVVPSEVSFKFVPPALAQRVDQFPKTFETGGGPSLEGQLLPEFMLADVGGKPIPTSSLRGKVVVLDIWATWCPPCLRELEQLSDIYSQNHDKGMVLITIDEDDDLSTAQEFLKAKNYIWANVHDDGRITKALGGAEAVPRTLIVDRNGRVLFDRGSGSEATIEEILSKLILGFETRK
jgi:thiol-disulfide isomerase/thioredoxin